MSDKRITMVELIGGPADGMEVRVSAGEHEILVAYQSGVARYCWSEDRGWFYVGDKTPHRQ